MIDCQEIITDVEVKPYIEYGTYPDVPDTSNSIQAECMQEIYSLYTNHTELAGLFSMLQVLLIPDFYNRKSPGSSLATYPIPQIYVYDTEEDIPIDYGFAKIPLVNENKWLSVDVKHIPIAEIQIDQYVDWAQRTQDVWWSNQVIINPELDELVSHIPEDVLDNSVIITGTAGAGKTDAAVKLAQLCHSMTSISRPISSLFPTNYTFDNQDLYGFPLVTNYSNYLIKIHNQSAFQLDSPGNMRMHIPQLIEATGGIIEPPPCLELGLIPKALASAYPDIDIANMDPTLFSPTFDLIKRSKRPILVALSVGQGLKHLQALDQVYSDMVKSTNENTTDNNTMDMVANLSAIFAGSSPFVRSMLSLQSLGVKPIFYSSKQARQIQGTATFTPTTMNSPQSIFSPNAPHHNYSVSFRYNPLSGFDPYLDTMRMLNMTGIASSWRVEQDYEIPSKIIACPEMLFEFSDRIETDHLHTMATQPIQDFLATLYHLQDFKTLSSNFYVDVMRTFESFAICLDDFVSESVKNEAGKQYMAQHPNHFGIN